MRGWQPASHPDPGGILLTHETYSLMKDVVSTDGDMNIAIKGFSSPVRVHRVAGLHESGGQGDRVIQREADGLLLVIDQKRLTEQGRADAITALREAAERLAAA